MNKEIFFSSQFTKSYKSLIRNNRSLQKRITQRVEIFINDKFASILRDHKLKGKKKSFRAFSITGDIRVIYEETVDSFIFLDIGTHSQVY